MSITTKRAARRTRALGFLTTTALPAALLLPLAGGCSAASDGRALPSATDKPVHVDGELARRGVVRMPQAGQSPSAGGVHPNNAISDAGITNSGTLSYFGGPVISNVHIFQISWGAGGDGGVGAVPPSLVSTLPTFYQTITNSPYWAWLAQYNTVGLDGVTDNQPGSNQVIGPGTFVESITITPNNQSSTISDSDIANEIVYQYDHGVIPGLSQAAGTLDSANNVNVVYMFDFPSTITLTLGGTPLCAASGTYGYHESAAVLEGSVTYNIPFGVVPDVINGGCVVSGASQSPLDTSLMVHSHELAESVTDPAISQSFSFDRPMAWYDVHDQISQGTGGEIGDLCAFQFGTVMGFAVQKLWSNVNNGCIDVPPTCNGSVPPPYCIPCTMSSQCSGGTPVCDTASASPFFGQCVACTGTTGCGGATPYCDGTTDTCRACTASDCTGTTPICETTGAAVGTCVSCDAQNHSACTGATPICDPNVFLCVGCVTNMDCPTATPTCDIGTQMCRACAANSDCAGEVCVTEAGSSKVGQCVGCLANTDCGGSNADCDLSTNTCTCTSDSQCDNPKPTCTANKCVACKTDGDCSGSKSGPVCTGGSCVPKPVVPVDAGYDASLNLAPLPDAGKGGSSGGGGCTMAPGHDLSDLASVLVPALAFFGVRARRRSRAQPGR